MPSLRGCSTEFSIVYKSPCKSAKQNTEIALPLLSRQTSSEIKEDDAILYSWFSLDLDGNGAAKESHKSRCNRTQYKLHTSCCGCCLIVHYLLVHTHIASRLWFRFSHIAMKMHFVLRRRLLCLCHYTNCTRTPFYFWCRAHRVVEWGHFIGGS